MITKMIDGYLGYLRKPVLLLFILACCLGALPLWADDAAPLTVTPGQIKMGADYNGTTLKIAGRVPSGSEVVLRFIGAVGELRMKEKEKVFGLLWMNRNAVTFRNVPQVYLVQSSQPFDRLGPAGGPYSLESLPRLIEVDQALADHSNLDPSAELLRLKAIEGLCRQSVGGFAFGPDSDGRRTFMTDLQLPAALPPGDYIVEVVTLKDGQLAGKETVQVHAALVGLPAWLSALSTQHGLIYGILATVTAILGGLLISLVFQGKGGAH